MSMAQQMRSRQSVRPAGSLKSVSHTRTASGKGNSCMAQSDDVCTLQAHLQLAGAHWREKVRKMHVVWMRMMQAGSGLMRQRPARPT